MGLPANHTRIGIVCARSIISVVSGTAAAINDGEHAMQLHRKDHSLSTFAVILSAISSANSVTATGEALLTLLLGFLLLWCRGERGCILLCLQSLGLRAAVVAGFIHHAYLNLTWLGFLRLRSLTARSFS